MAGSVRRAPANPVLSYSVTHTLVLFALSKVKHILRASFGDYMAQAR